MAESLPLPDSNGQGELDNCLREEIGEVTAILDMDGYMVDGEFKCVELGWKYLNHPHAYSFFFYHGGMRELSVKDRITANYVHRNIFDIPYGEFWPGMLKGSKVETLVEHLHGRGIVAFKGGCIEKNVLKHLRIPGINLEEFGCPKVDTLLKECPFTFKTCGHHQLTSAHCPREEVSVMEWWLNRFMWGHNIANTVQPKVKNPFDYMSGGDFAFI